MYQLKGDQGKNSIYGKHLLTLLHKIAKDLNISIDTIIDFDLNGYDCQSPRITG